MKGHGGGSRMWRAWAEILLAMIPAALFILLASDERSATAQVPPDPITRAWGINSFGQLGDDSFAPRSKQVEVKGEGKTLVDTETITDDSTGPEFFTSTLARSVPAGQSLTATATDANTSEFSMPRIVRRQQGVARTGREIFPESFSPSGLPGSGNG